MSCGLDSRFSLVGFSNERVYSQTAAARDKWAKVILNFNVNILRLRWRVFLMDGKAHLLLCPLPDKQLLPLCFITDGGSGVEVISFLLQSQKKSKGWEVKSLRRVPPSDGVTWEQAAAIQTHGHQGDPGGETQGFYQDIRYVFIVDFYS